MRSHEVHAAGSHIWRCDQASLEFHIAIMLRQAFNDQFRFCIWLSKESRMQEGMAARAHSVCPGEASKLLQQRCLPAISHFSQ